MKKLINRIRRWLIRKLGGYTEPFIVPPAQTINIRPVSLRATYAISRWDHFAIENMEIAIDCVKQKMIQDLVEGIIKADDLIRWQRCDEQSAIIFSATLDVVPESERRKLYV